MHTFLLHQYQLVLSARTALFDYCETVKQEDLLKPLPTVNNESMISLLMHVANCYLFWLSKSVIEQQRNYFKNEDHQTLASVRSVYGQVDLVMNEFLHHFTDDSLGQQILITRPDGSQLTRSPFEIFTHAITHEFHHKGQVINMSRQLGYTPVDTDVVRE